MDSETNDVWKEENRRKEKENMTCNGKINERNRERKKGRKRA